VARDESAIGRVGVVIVATRGQRGPGEVRLRIRGGTENFLAWSREPLPAGTVVLRGRAETNEVLDLLWRMRDSIEATVALAPIRPRRFVLRQNENDRRRETTIVAEGAQLVGTLERAHRPARRAVVPLGPKVHDPASVAYAIRALATDRSAATTYDVLAGTKVYTVTVKPAGTETIEAVGRTWPARRFRLSLDLTPRDAESPPASALPSPVSSNAPSRARDDLNVQEAELWVSAGPERLPLRMRAETFWGWVTLELVDRGR